MTTPDMWAPVEIIPAAEHDAQLAAQVRLELHDDQAENTVAAYRVDWQRWNQFCVDIGVDPQLRGQVVDLSNLLVRFIQWMIDSGVRARVRGRRGLVAKPPAVATLQRRVAGAAEMLRVLHGPVAVPVGVTHSASQAIAHYRKRMRQARVRVDRGPARVVSEEQMRLVFESAPDTLAGLRNKTIMVVWWNTGWRVSEIAARCVEDVTDFGERMELVADWSKTEEKVAVLNARPDPEFCPVRLVRSWLSESGIGSGPLFREVHRSGRVQQAPLTRQSVRRIFIGMTETAGLTIPVTAHSVRGSVVTRMRRNGAPRKVIEAQVGFAAGSQQLARYEQELDRDQRDVSQYLGL